MRGLCPDCDSWDFSIVGCCQTCQGGAQESYFYPSVRKTVAPEPEDVDYDEWKPETK